MTQMANIAINANDIVAGKEETIVLHDIDDIRIIVFNRPSARNALSREMRKGFSSVINQTENTENIKAVILTGAGGAFCAGVDIKEIRSDPGHPMVRPNPAEVIRDMKKPVIAAVNGPCVTGALEIALSCSFIIASEQASFADTHAKVGLFPAWGLSALLPRSVGVRRARQMSMTGMFISAATAYDWGLVNELAPAETLLQRCMAVARDIACADGPSLRLQLDVLNAYENAAQFPALAAEATALELFRRSNVEE